MNEECIVQWSISGYDEIKDDLEGKNKFNRWYCDTCIPHKYT